MRARRVGIAGGGGFRPQSHVGSTRAASRGVAGSAVATRTKRASPITGAIMTVAQIAKATFHRASPSLPRASFPCGVLCAFMFGPFAKSSGRPIETPDRDPTKRRERSHNGSYAGGASRRS